MFQRERGASALRWPTGSRAGARAITVYEARGQYQIQVAKSGPEARAASSNDSRN